MCVPMHMYAYRLFKHTYNTNFWKLKVSYTLKYFQRCPLCNYIYSVIPITIGSNSLRNFFQLLSIVKSKAKLFPRSYVNYRKKSFKTLLVINPYYLARTGCYLKRGKSVQYLFCSILLFKLGKIWIFLNLLI